MQNDTPPSEPLHTLPLVIAEQISEPKYTSTTDIKRHVEGRKRVITTEEPIEISVKRFV